MIKRLILTAFWVKLAKATYESSYKMFLEYQAKNGARDQDAIDRWNEYVDEEIRRKHWSADRLSSLKVKDD